jgi:hypothetical protein
VTRPDGVGAAAVVAGADLERLGASLDVEPQVLRARVPDRVRHDLLDASKDGLSVRGVFDGDVWPDRDVDAGARNSARELAQGRRQIEARRLAHVRDGAPDVPEEQARDRLRRLDARPGVPSREMARDLEVQRERRQMVSEDVVHVACDARALRLSSVLRQKLAGRPQLRVDREETLAGGALLGQESGEPVGDELKREVGGRENDAPVPVPVEPDDREHRGALESDPDARGLRRQETAELERHDHEQRALEPEAGGQRDHREDGRRLAGDQCRDGRSVRPPRGRARRLREGGAEEENEAAQAAAEGPVIPGRAAGKGEPAGPPRPRSRSRPGEGLPRVVAKEHDARARV